MLHWMFSAVLCLLASQSALGQCPSENSQCSCIMHQTVIRVYQCDDLGDVAGLPYLGETDDLIQVIQVSSSIVRSISNDSFAGLKTRTLDLRSIGIKRLEVNAFAGLENYIENLYLVGNDIQLLPVGIFSDMVHLRTLTLDRNSITTIEIDQFKGLQRLTHLGIESNNIASIGEGAFNGLPSLKYLYLQHNLIHLLPLGLFDGLENMQELNLVGNRISTLHPDVFSKMPLIKQLHISDNLLETLPYAIFDSNRNLKTINLGDNKISSTLTNRHFVGPRTVEFIDLSFNNLTNFHPSTFHNLKNLRKLFLGNNKFKKLAASTFEGLDNIEELHLQQNMIRNLPANSFIGMPNLKRLDISRNQLQKLGFGIFDPFGHLQWLDISRNEIETVEHGPFITLRSLEFLDISWNRLPVVNHDWFVQDNWDTSTKPLKELYLYNNLIKHIDPETFWPLKNLEKLDISMNRIFTLNETVFKTFSTLKEIYIHNNPLHNISKGLFSGLNKIKTLDISDTCLTEIDQLAFDGMAALEKLDVSGGFINEIHPESFRGVGRISILNVSYNNLTVLERDVFTYIGDSLEVLHLDHNALTMEGLGHSLDFAKILKVLDISFNKFRNIYGVGNLQEQGVLLKLMANPIHCDCSVSWLSNYASVADFEDVLCESPDYINGENAVCFPFTSECSQAPVSQMYINYCARRSNTLVQQADNSSTINGTNIEESYVYSWNTIEEYNAYCIEPMVPSTSPKPDNRDVEDKEHLPNSLEIEVDVDHTTLYVTWQYQNNSKILGYRLTCREFAENNIEKEKLILDLQKTNYTLNELNLGSNYIICVGIILDDESILTDSKSCREIALFSLTTKSPGAGATPASIDRKNSFPIKPLIGTCIAVVIVLVILLIIITLCLKRKPQKEENEYIDEKLRDKMGMWVNSFNYSGGVNEQIAEQSTVEVDIFAPLAVSTKKSSSRKSNGHINT